MFKLILMSFHQLFCSVFMFMGQMHIMRFFLPSDELHTAGSVCVLRFITCDVVRNTSTMATQKFGLVICIICLSTIKGRVLLTLVVGNATNTL